MKIIIIHPEDEEAVVRLIGRLKDKDPLLDAIGALLVRTSQQAFLEQRFGEHAWPQRYEGNRAEPFVNVAGLIADLNAGRTPPQRRFDRRPALMDRGELMRSISYRRLDADSVETGTVLPYGPVHHRGGETSQPITSDTKQRLWKWLKGKRDRLKRKSKKEGSEAAAKDLDQHRALMRRLGWLMNKNTTELLTKVHRRPFVGVTERDADEIRELVESYVADEW